MAFVELSRTTGDRKYVDLAGYILHGDERVPLRPQQIVYMYCRIPFTSRTKLEGHAVRAMYACCGATDYYLETGDQAYWKTLSVLWNDLTAHQLYVNGGVGARAAGEAFGRSVRATQCAGVWRELRGDREQDVELAHASRVGQCEVH